VKRVALYAASSALIIAALAGVTSMFVTGVGRQAVWASASLAFVIQMVAFMVVRMMPARQMMVGWGLGAILRLMSVIVWGVFLAKVWNAPIAAGLVSYAGFLFLTTVMEPAFLKR
jgi:hypothetical protein